MRAPAPFSTREVSPRDIPVVRVFVSSTWLDLEPERQAVETALARLDTKFVGMEHFGSREETTLETSLAEVDRSDLYLGIIAGRYGSGITKAEYRRAGERGLDRYLYLKQSPAWTESDPDQQARLQEFLGETVRHTRSSFTTPDDLGARITADLHRWLVDKVLIPRLRKAGFSDALAGAYLPPWPVFERLDLDRFTGRLWLTTEVDHFLAAHDRGYFILEADAGLGKSAFLAHLVRERGWIHHFVELARGQDGIRHGQNNLAAQIALTWEPEHAGSLADVSRPDLLQELLFAAARRRDLVSPGEKIVLVIDGLDESAALPQQNVMGLPRVLPSGVYLVVSQRPVQVILETEAPRQVVRLQSGEARNLDDMREFLERVAQSERVAAVLAESSIAPEDFVSTLLERSQGIWIYLHYILEEIERGERRPLDLEALPRGLWPYYARHWQRRRTGPDWAAVELPLLAALAAAQEEVPAGFLCDFAGISETPQVHRLLREDWRPFLATSVAGERRYRCYHASFREFLEGRADRSLLTESEEALADELEAATRAAHSRIADRALKAWGGFENRLEGLNDPTRRDLDGGYALRHVAAHLEGAGRLSDLSRLLRTESEQDENVWFAVHEKTKDLAGYLSDVGRIWLAAEAASQDSIDRGEPAVSVALEARCALLIASVHSLADQIGPSLLAALVEKRIWEPEHALTYARKIQMPSKRFVAMAHLVLVLPEPAREKALNEAVAAARWSAQWAFAALPPGLPRELLTALVRQEIATPSWWHTHKLAALVPKLPEDLLTEILSWLRTADPAENWTDLLITLLPLVSPDVQEELLQMEKERFEGKWGPLKLESRVRIAPFLPSDKKEALARKILEIARTERAHDRVLLARIVPLLQNPEREALARETLEAAFALPTYEKEKVMRELIPQLPTKLLKVAEKRLFRDSWNWENDSYIRLFTPHWAGRARRTERALSSIEKEWSRSEALAALVPVLPDSLIERALRSALTSHEPAAAVDALAPRLSRSQLERALALLLEVGVSGDIYSHEESRSELIERLSARGSRERDSRPADDTTLDIEKSRKAEAAVLERGFARHKAEALIVLAAKAPKGERPRLLTQALRFSQRARSPQLKTELLLSAALLSGEPERQQRFAKVLARVRSWAPNYSYHDLVRNLLTAMSPHLEEPLLREALACTSALQNESNMRPILRELIPRLPETQAAEALLFDPGGPNVLSHGLSESRRSQPPRYPDGLFGRAWKLVPRRVRSTSIARRATRSLIDCFRSRTRARILVDIALAGDRIAERDWIERALSATYSLASPSDRIEILTNLFPYLSAYRVGDVAVRALAAALAISNPFARADALEALAPWLHPYYQTRLRHTAQALRHPSPVAELTDATALETLQDSASLEGILSRLDLVAEDDHEPLLARARQIAKNLEIPTLQAWTLLQLVPYLPVGEGEDVVRKRINDYGIGGAVLHLIESWGRRRSPFAESVARALLELLSSAYLFPEILATAAPHLPDTVLHDALVKAWTIHTHKTRRGALRALAARLISLPAVDLYPLWQEALQRAAGGTRESALSDLEALLPVLEHLGGREALAEIKPEYEI